MILWKKTKGLSTLKVRFELQCTIQYIVPWSDAELVVKKGHTLRGNMSVPILSPKTQFFNFQQDENRAQLTFSRMKTAITWIQYDDRAHLTFNTIKTALT